MHHQVGQNIADPARRAAWRDFLAALDAAAAPGGPLEGFLFHGTCADRAASIALEGVTTTGCIVPGERDDWIEADGTHWGTPLVAGFYAEDRIESMDDPDLELAIVAARMSDLEDCGLFATDGQTLDCPLHTRLGRSEQETELLWDASDGGWRACLDVYGTLVVLGPVGEEAVTVLASVADIEALAASVSAPRP